MTASADSTAEVTQHSRRLLPIANAAAEAGARVALDRWRDRASLTVRTKANENDLVSEADLETQRAIEGVLNRLRPSDRICGEEDIGPRPARSSAAVEWWIDPIDGTTSFLYGRADWSVSVAAVDPADGRVLAAVVMEPVLGVVTEAALGAGAWRNGASVRVAADRPLSQALVSINLGRPDQRGAAGDMVAALSSRVRDLRRTGSAAATLADLAGGRTDAVWVPGLQPWDGLAGILLAAEAGAVVGDLDGALGPVWPPSGDVLAAPAHLWDDLRGALAPGYGRP